MLLLLLILLMLDRFSHVLCARSSVIAILMQNFAAMGLIFVLWFLFVFSLCFGHTYFIWGSITTFGAFNNVDDSPLYRNYVDPSRVAGTVVSDIPGLVFAGYQGMFACITPALMTGAFADRLRFGPYLIFISLWIILVYAPFCHWIWGGGWMAAWGVRDFAGGIVVHTTAGVSALVIAMMLGARRGFPRETRPPHNPGMTYAGAAMLWVGWFGFNGGSALAADGSAGMAIIVTHTAAAAASLTWMAIEWVRFGRPSMVGLVTGTIAGLATVTPASGFIGPWGGLVCGVAGGAICFEAVQIVKMRLHIDDSLDVFAVHGVGGMLGSLLLAGLMLPSLGGPGLKEGVSVIDQLGLQALGIGVTALWSIVATFVILRALQLFSPLRVSQQDEIEGLDLTVHGERAYEL